MLLRDLRISKIEWACVDTICTLRFSFNNGTTSVAFGNRFPVTDSFELPEDREIKSIKVSVRGKSEYMESITFADENQDVILDIRGATVTG